MTSPRRDSRNRSAGADQRRCGFVLLAVLVFVMLLSMVAMSLLFRFKAEETAAASSLSSEQSWSAALSGVQEAMRMARQSTAGSLDWRDNRRAFHERLVYEDGSDRWYFTLFSPPDDDSTDDVRYGLTDEASCLNVNHLPADGAWLSGLPGLTSPLLQALQDFIDADDQARSEGAEQEYYAGLPLPYAVRNGPLRTFEEMRLVRGFTASVLFGEDVNLNGRLDPNENDADERWPRDNNDGRLERGLRQFLTVASSEPEVDNNGNPRVNLNDPNARLPDIELPPPFTNFLAALHSSKQSLRHPADLYEGSIRVRDDAGRESDVLSGVGKEELPALLDRFKTTKEARREGLINVNTAPIPVLVTIPGIDETVAEAIASTRKSIAPERRATLAWLVQEGVVDAARFKEMAPYLTARSFQFHFTVVGYGVPSGRYRVLEAVIDTAETEPRVIYLRDMTRLGLPIRIESPQEGVSPGEARVSPPNHETHPTHRAAGTDVSPLPLHG